MVYKVTIFTIKEDSKGNQKLRRGGGKMEETLCGWRKWRKKVEGDMEKKVKRCGGKIQVLSSDYFTN